MICSKHDKLLLEKVTNKTVRFIFLDKDGSIFVVADIIELDIDNIPNFKRHYRIDRVGEFECRWPVDFGRAKTLDTKIRKAIEQMPKDTSEVEELRKLESGYADDSADDDFELEVLREAQRFDKEGE